MDLKDIKAIIDLMKKNSVTEFELEKQDFKIRLKRGANTREIKSPMIGTFYRAPSPEAAAYIEIGAEVGPETVVCIIEAMKVMNEIKAEAKGVITQVLIENAKPVEFGQPLFKLRPS